MITIFGGHQIAALLIWRYCNGKVHRRIDNYANYYRSNNSGESEVSRTQGIPHVQAQSSVPITASKCESKSRIKIANPGGETGGSNFRYAQYIFPLCDYLFQGSNNITKVKIRIYR